MRTHDHQPHQSNRSKWILIGFLAVAAYFLWSEHKAHLMAALPYLLFLACPLMHLFHHHGHGKHHGQPDQREANRRPGHAGEES
ncbi:DUF2933 domain-containing protein [Noviherbaspirillum denitrificans]|uniref:DUF2933 domain-containing protein n=1 Tax=Noviherbaspirillum denitrificans TaxID=1968433 RepID=UPI000B530053|nr:DUF2933 domain-containing protein [Noviherbaspirillum denitrificans]